MLKLGLLRLEPTDPLSCRGWETCGWRSQELVQSELRSVLCREFRSKMLDHPTRTSARHRQGRPGLAELAARQESVVGVGGWVGVWLQVGASAPPAARVRRELRRKRWRPREGGSRQTPAQSTCLDTLGFWGGGAPATSSMDPHGGNLFQDALSSAQPWSTLAAGNTCEYSTPFKTYADNLEFVLLKNNNNWILQMD